MIGELVELEHDLDAAVVMREQGDPLGRALRHEDRGELRAQALLGGEVADELVDRGRSPDRGVQGDPELGLERAHREVAIVGRAIHAVAGEAAVQRLVTTRRVEAAVEVAELRGEQRERALRHRDIEVDAAPRALATEQRREDPRRGPQRATRKICDLHARQHRRPAGDAAHRERPGQRGVVEVVTCAMRIGSGLAEAADRAQDDLRIRCGEGRVPDAELVHHARPEALDHDIRGRHHPQQRGATGRRLEVERERALPAIHGEEPARQATLAGRQAPQVVANAWVLDLHDIGAEIREHHRQERPRQEPRQIEDAGAGQRACQARWVHFGRAISNSCCSFIASIGSPETRSLPWK